MSKKVQKTSGAGVQYGLAQWFTAWCKAVHFVLQSSTAKSNGSHHVI